MQVDLAALQWNYRLLRDQSAPAECTAVVKADAYGLGMERVAEVLAAAGCRSFFVATAAEGLQLRLVVEGASIYVLNGPLPGELEMFSQAGLIPVINSLEQLRVWLAGRATRQATYALQVDTGMHRLGVSEAELAGLIADWSAHKLAPPGLVMSHLACAEQTGHPMNQLQLHKFLRLAAEVSGARLSLANSSGIFLGAAYRFDLVRLGVALYGVNPLPGEVNPMRPVVRVEAPVIQVQTLLEESPIGYGASVRLQAGSRIATVAAGYADGYPRAAANRAQAIIAGRRAPVAGMVSMDLLTLDVSGLREEEVYPGVMATLVGTDFDVDCLALAADASSYEILIRLGASARREYLPPR